MYPSISQFVIGNALSVYIIIYSFLSHLSVPFSLPLFPSPAFFFFLFPLPSHLLFYNFLILCFSLSPVIYPSFPLSPTLSIPNSFQLPISLFLHNSLHSHILSHASILRRMNVCIVRHFPLHGHQ